MKPVAARVADLVSRLTRREKIDLVVQADTGFLPRLNLKEFKFFNTCKSGQASTLFSGRPASLFSGTRATATVVLHAAEGVG